MTNATTLQRNGFTSPLAGEVSAPTGPREARPEGRLRAPGGR